ncbi:hypothetical protein [Flagellimonas sp.]|uniref:hypothetical protein n=1 Tax=Flagellimonas sp. TaxID=2058762 RepID=UPI003F4A24A9
MKRIYLFAFLVFLFSACENKENDSYCIGPIENQNTVRANPDNLNGQFQFDYLISSQLKSNAEGSEEVYELDYFVNTSDGSKFLSRTTMMVNFGEIDSEFGSVDGVIIMPSGKTVIYVNDAQSNMKRAITVAMDGTREDKIFNDFVFLNEFFSNTASLREVADSKPNSISQKTKAFTATVNAPNGEKAKVTMHFGENQNGRVIETGVPLVGLLVGVVKDKSIGKCNRLAVYTKVESDEGVFEATLNKMTPSSQTFDGASYKEATLGVTMGAQSFSSQEISDEMDEAMERDYNRIQVLLDRLKDCASDDIDCKEGIELQMLEVQDRIQKRVADNASDPNALGNEGTDFATQKRQLERRLNRITAEIIKLGADCERIKLELDNCKSGCSGLERERKRCRQEIEKKEKEAQAISCQMLKLMGIEDGVEDCVQ